VHLSNARPRPIPLLLIGAALSALALGRLAIGVAGIGQVQQLDYGEPLVYADAARLLASQPLYQSLDQPPYTVTAYTPLYYVVSGALQGLTGPSFAPGRMLSYLACLATALLIGSLTARFARSVWPGLLAALMYVGLAFPGRVPWFALYRVDLLAEALAFGAIFVLTRGSTNRYIVASSVLAGLAILTKQSYLAAALAGSVWLAISRRRVAFLFATISIGLPLVICAGLQLGTSAFVANAIQTLDDPISADQVWDLGLAFAAPLGLVTLIACVYVFRERPWHDSQKRLLLIYWVAAALQLPALAKFGAGPNYWIELAAPTAVFAALGLWSSRAWPRLIDRVLVWLLALNLALVLLGSLPAAASGLAGTTTLNGLQGATPSEFSELVNLIRTEPGPVLADPLDVVVLAGRPVLLEPVIFAILDKQGRWDAQPLAERVCAGRIPLVVLGFPIDAVAQYVPYGQPWWPPRVMHAMQTCMQPVGQLAGRYLYAPPGADIISPVRDQRTW
jgi:hypothetical protein